MIFCRAILNLLISQAIFFSSATLSAGPLDKLQYLAMSACEGLLISPLQKWGLLPNSNPSVGEEWKLWLLEAKQAAKEGLEPVGLTTLLAKTPQLNTADRQWIFNHIQFHYSSTMGNPNLKPLKRKYDYILKFLIPESLHFTKLAAENGPLKAYELYFEAMSRLHGDNINWVQFERVKAKVKIIRDLFLVHKTTQPHLDSQVILAGSLINGHGFETSDLDGGFFPFDINSYLEIPDSWDPKKKEIAIDTLRILDLNGLTYSTQETNVEAIWKKPSFLNKLQPFMIRITEKEIQLIHFPPRLSDKKFEHHIYKLDW